MKNTTVRAVRYANGEKLLRMHKDWFKDCEAFSMKVDHRANELIITKHYLDVPRNAIRGSVQGNVISISCKGGIEVALGEYSVDAEESTEDIIVIPLY